MISVGNCCKNPFKISFKWLILYLLLAFIGWQMYKPKPKPPKVSLYEKGYIQIPIAGADFEKSKKKISIATVPKIKLWWTSRGIYQLGDRVHAGIGGSPTGGYPFMFWVKKEDLINLSEKERTHLGITIDQEGNVSAPKGLLGVKYTLY